MLKTIPAFLAVGTIWLASSPAQARSSGPDPLDDAMALLQSDPVAAVVALEALSAAGDMEATATLALTLENNPPGVEADPERSKRLWAKALAGGSQNARLNIGTRKLLNDDVSDDAEAVALLQDLREPFQPFAAYPLGRAYLFGNGVERDLERATRLMQVAVDADPGNTDARFLLGRAYQNGWGVPADKTAAFRHMKIAADSGDARAQWNLGMMLLSGAGAASNPPLAYRYVRQASEQGYEDGMISLAVMLALGQGVKADPAEARTWYGRAASQGSAHALRGLGMMILLGEGGPSDPVTGAAYVELAAEAGDANAAAMLQHYAEPLSQLPRASIDAVMANWTKEFGPLK